MHGSIFTATINARAAAAAAAERHSTALDPH